MKKTIAIVCSLTLVIAAFTGCSNASTNQGKTMEYEDKLLNDSVVHEINVDIGEEDWQDLLENPLEKSKYKADVTIDGETFSEVSFATKGNTSLSQIASDDTTDRYSFKINFDKYVDGQTYYGLDKLSLNNLMSDATYMKDYFSYEMMREAGAAAPLTSFVNISINGEPWGLYLAVEDVSDSFLSRNYGEDAGELYKPETEQLNNMGNMGKEGMKAPADMAQSVSGGAMGERPEGMPNGQSGSTTSGAMQAPPDWSKDGNKAGEGAEGFGGSSKGASLAYTDDQLDSYSDIFDNGKTDATEEDQQRVVTALKQLSTGEDLENALDVESIIKYFVAHNFVDNYDSYTGNMLHNYYLYEKDGVLSMIPWDYNLAFGAFGGMKGPGAQRTGNTTEADGDQATSMVNYAIDTPLSGAQEADRPMWSFIVNNEQYKELYHQYFDEFITSYFESGKFEEKITSVYNMIRPYVEKDATAFYTVDEFDKAYSTLKEFCLLRAASIRAQLSGDLPSTTEAQQAEGVQLIDASSLSIEDMGSQGGGPQQQRKNQENGENGNKPEGSPQ